MAELFMKNCEGCKISTGKKEDMKGGVILLDDYWVLNHCGDRKQAFLGWMVLQPRYHRMELTELEKGEVETLGFHIQNIEMALRQYWCSHFEDDPIQRVYVVYFFESVFDKPKPTNYHLHIHIIARPKSVGELLRKDNETTINAWKIYTLNQDKRFNGSDYNLDLVKGSSEQKISALVEYLRGYLWELAK